MKTNDLTRLEQSWYRLKELHIIDAESTPTNSPYSTALTNNLVSIMDCQTIQDLLEIANIQDAPELHALLLALFISRNQGSICLPIRESVLQDIFSSFMETEHIKPYTNKIIKNLEDTTGTCWSSLIAHMEDTPRPIFYDPNSNNLYFRKYYSHEKSLHKHFIQLVASADMVAANSDHAAITERVKNASRYEKFSLTTEQMCGVYLALINRFTIISGGPGTGKTTMICSILRAFLNQHPDQPIERIHLVAPTGRAGQRMGDAIQQEISGASDEKPDIVNKLTALSGSTIHRLLKYNPGKHAFVYNKYNKLPTDLLIVDEVSMIDVTLMDDLLEAIPGTARIIFLGDKHQLPSVDAGAVMGDLLPTTATPEFTQKIIDDLRALTTNDEEVLPAQKMVAAATPGSLTNHIMLLTKSQRFSGQLGETAQAINAGDTSLPDRFLDPEDETCALVETAVKEHTRPVSSKTAWREAWTADWTNPGWDQSCRLLDASDKPLSYLYDILFGWSHTFLAELRDGQSYCSLTRQTIPDEDLFNAERIPASIFERLQQSQILTLMRRGPYGAKSINRYLAHLWMPIFDAQGQDNCFAGAPIMITRNSPVHGLFNGDVGITLRSTSGRYAVVFRRGGSVITHPFESLPEHELAFACTVHKSQGSQYGRLLMIMPDEVNHPLLSRQILYTGITRAKETAILYTNPETFKNAIQTSIQRHSGLNLWGVQPEVTPSVYT